jgi:hypothetical protein
VHVGVQRFLATINSTVIDWFQPWPEVSLLSVARKFLDEVDLMSDTVRNAVVEFMPFSFSAVNNVSVGAQLGAVEAAGACKWPPCHACSLCLKAACA